MSSQYFTTSSVGIQKISNISDKLDYGIVLGAQQITMNTFKANSVAASSIGFNINVPLNMLVDRKIYIESTTTFDINVGSSAAIGAGGGTWILAANGDHTQIGDGVLCLQYGQQCAFQSFPFNNMISNASCTINTSSTSFQSQSMVPIIMRAMAAENLQKYEGNCPALSDRFFIDYDSMNGNVSSNLFDDFAANSYGLPYSQARGSFPIKFNSIVHSREPEMMQ